jgi:hypothetical protein
MWIESLKAFLNRITGVSTPFGGVSWTPTVLEAEVARRVVRLLENQRVLFSVTNVQVPPEYGAGAVRRLRENLNEELQQVANDEAPLAVALRAMLKECRRFAALCESIGVDAERGGNGALLSQRQHAEYVGGLERLRESFAKNVRLVSDAYGVEVHDELADEVARRAPER